MGQRSPKEVLFLCTTNYYRSRFAEILFNSAVAKMGLPWKAVSRGLAVERGANNIGPMAKEAVQLLHERFIVSPETKRLPAQVTLADLEKATRVIALNETEHLPLLAEHHAAWADKVETWHIDDAPEALGLIEQHVMDLVARLLGGGSSSQAESRLAKIAAETAAVQKPPRPKALPSVRVGRETKGRRGKGVTIISDLPLNSQGLEELATTLKQRCGTGGTVKDNQIEIQGDQRDRLTALLEGLGYKVKRVGG